MRCVCFAERINFFVIQCNSFCVFYRRVGLIPSLLQNRIQNLYHAEVFAYSDTGDDEPIPQEITFWLAVGAGRVGDISWKRKTFTHYNWICSDFEYYCGNHCSYIKHNEENWAVIMKKYCSMFPYGNFCLICSFSWSVRASNVILKHIRYDQQIWVHGIQGNYQPAFL